MKKDLRKNINDNNYDIRNTLLSREIEAYKGYNRKTQKEIIAEIENAFSLCENEDLKTKIA